MGLFSNKSKMDKFVEKKTREMKNNAISKGGRCSNCRYYSSNRGVCTYGNGHVTSPNNVCEWWKI